MQELVQFLHAGAATAGGVGLLYSGTVTVVALTAVLAPTPERRRAARQVLRVLLRRDRNR